MCTPTNSSPVIYKKISPRDMLISVGLFVYVVWCIHTHEIIDGSHFHNSNPTKHNCIMQGLSAEPGTGCPLLGSLYDD